MKDIFINYNKVVKYLPNTKRRKRLSSDEREFNGENVNHMRKMQRMVLLTT